MTNARIFGNIIQPDKISGKALLDEKSSRISPGGKISMTKYEMLYILDKDVSDEGKEAIIKKFEDLVTANGGSVEQTDRWGMRKLQYPINYKNEGYYVLMTFEAEKTLVVELKRVAGITDGIIRRLITKK